MPFPKTQQELVAAEYRYSGEEKCRGCDLAREWWRTPDSRKKLPMNPMRSGEDPAAPHWLSCIHARDFRFQK